jgi:Transposase
MRDLRRRYAVGGAKSDRADCYVLADVARTDGHRLRRLEPLSARTRALRAVVTRDDLVDQRTGLANQLRAPWRPTGRARWRSSPTPTPRSAWRSWSATHPGVGRPPDQGPPGQLPDQGRLQRSAPS